MTNPPHSRLLKSKADLRDQWQTGTNVTSYLLLLMLIYFLSIQSIYTMLHPLGKTSFEPRPATKQGWYSLCSSLSALSSRWS